MGDIVKLKGETSVHGSEAVVKVVAWLRDQADALENGEARPAHKAVLTVFEDCSGQIRTHTAFCNASTVELVGIMYLALNDAAGAD
jgi:hypothetical protein